MAFFECENFDPLYKIIGEIIGVPIERLVIDSTARGLQSYISRFIPEETKDLLRSMKPGDAVLREKCRQVLDALNVGSTMLARINGSGRYEGKDYRYEGDENDYSRTWVTEPYSVPFVVGSLAGHIGAMLGGAREVEYKEISPGVYELISRPVPAADEELEERLPLRDYKHKEGDIELARCATCGGPAALAHCKWHLDRGVIVNTFTRRRMAILGPSLLDRVFDELEYELGDTIPRTVVEAQRRFVKTGFYSIEEVENEGNMRDQFALRGLGNLKGIEMGKRGVRARVDNAILHLMVVGLIQGLFEMAFDLESHAEWEFSEDGDLTVEITPRGMV